MGRPNFEGLVLLWVLAGCIGFKHEAGWTYTIGGGGLAVCFGRGAVVLQLGGIVSGSSGSKFQQR